MTKIQQEKLEALGREIAQQWLDACPGDHPDRDYQFDAVGDYNAVVELCEELGLNIGDGETWGSVWDAVTEGYQHRLDQNRKLVNVVK